MTNHQSLDYADSGPARPTIRNINVSDLKEVLVKGYQDFDAKPTHFVLLFIIAYLSLIGFPEADNPYSSSMGVKQTTCKR